MKGIAGFLVLTSLASACDKSKPDAESTDTERSKVNTSLSAAFEEPVTTEGAEAKPAPDPEPSASQNAPSASADAPREQGRAASRQAVAGESDDTGKKNVGPSQTLVSGPAAAGEGFKVQMQTQSPQVVGKQGTLIVKLTADSPYKCNKDYPYKFKFEPVDGVTFPKETVRGMQVTKHEGTLSVPFSPQQTGKQSVSGDLSFSVCTDDKCLIEKQRISVSFDVVDAS